MERGVVRHTGVGPHQPHKIIGERPQRIFVMVVSVEKSCKNFQIQSFRWYSSVVQVVIVAGGRQLGVGIEETSNNCLLAGNQAAPAADCR